jgi:transcription elongation factor Elf1
MKNLICDFCGDNENSNKSRKYKNKGYAIFCQKCYLKYISFKYCIKNYKLFGITSKEAKEIFDF